MRLVGIQGEYIAGRKTLGDKQPDFRFFLRHMAPEAKGLSIRSK
jgi:hypothetical protein